MISRQVVRQWLPGLSEISGRSCFKMGVGEMMAVMLETLRPAQHDGDLPAMRLWKINHLQERARLKEQGAEDLRGKARSKARKRDSLLALLLRARKQRQANYNKIIASHSAADNNTHQRLTAVTNGYSLVDIQEMTGMVLVDEVRRFRQAQQRGRVYKELKTQGTSSSCQPFNMKRCHRRFRKGHRCYPNIASLAPRHQDSSTASRQCVSCWADCTQTLYT